MAHAAAEVSSSRPDKPFAYLDRHNGYTDEVLRALLSQVRTIAMVGASTLWRRPSFYAMKYLRHKGFRVIPVNPTRAGETILEEPVYASIADIPGTVDMVQIFRTSPEAYAITEDVIANKEEKNIKVLWMQLTVRDDAAAELAEESGLTVIMDRCPKIEYARLSGELSWCGINSRVITAKNLRPPKA